LGVTQDEIQPTLVNLVGLGTKAVMCKGNFRMDPKINTGGVIRIMNLNYLITREDIHHEMVLGREVLHKARIVLTADVMRASAGQGSGATKVEAEQEARRMGSFGDEFWHVKIAPRTKPANRGLGDSERTGGTQDEIMDDPHTLEVQGTEVSNAKTRRGEGGSIIY
jgi:hypothetical protein